MSRLLLESFFSHKELYKTSLVSSGVLTSVYNFLSEAKSAELFGVTITIWLLVLFINTIDIYTGIKADTKRKNEIGHKFKFESNKGWRAIEKVFIFAAAIAFVHYFEMEILRLGLSHTFSLILSYVKISLFLYTVLVEMQSIGENEEVRWGKKSKVFVLLDSIVEVVNEGILQKIGSLFNKRNNPKEINVEDEEPK